ncbi:MAG: hypothetical protein KDM81_15045, partial [Verrucomicrobiae bacterium]|nr:hypothetical protein [Verrucomicrobiae bacterium]
IGGANALQVVSVLDADAGIELSGVTITGGSADAPHPQDGGAGIYVEVPSVDLTLRDCNIVGNRSGTTADDGVNGDGAGIFFDSANGSLDLNGCVVAGNGLLKFDNAVDGAGMEVYNAELTMTDCLFDGNFIQGSAGSGSSSGFAFAIFGTDVESCALTDVVIQNHNAAGSLSGSTSTIRAQRLASLSFVRCRFQGNSQNNGVADSLILTAAISSRQTTDCLFAGNEAPRLWNVQSFSPHEAQSLTFLNTTVARNNSTYFLYRLSTLANGIVSFGNCYVDEPLDPNLTSSFTIFRSHSVVTGFPADGNGNLDFPTTNPLFIDPRSPAEAPTTAGNYRLLPTSPLLDAGSNAATTSPLDLDENLRVQDGDGNGTGTIDIGAFEVIAADGSIEITAIAYDENTGQVTLTVESAAAITYTVEYNTIVAAGPWNTGPTGTLSAGTNTIPVPQNTYNGPQPRTYFRVVTP